MNEVLTDKDGRNAWIRLVSLKMEPPSLLDNRADTERFLRSLKEAVRGEVAVDLELTKKLPGLFREHRYQINGLIYEEGGIWHPIDVFPQGLKKEFYGLAVDLGTTTVVLRLLDLDTAAKIDEISFLNPQVDAGEDILSRIHFASQTGGLDALRTLILGRINEEVLSMARKHGIATESLVGMSLAGNTTMTHLFLGLDPGGIIREPYIPVVNKPGIITAETLGVAIHPLAPVLVFPNVGSYFGGDLIAGILASGMAQQKEVSMLVDVGTNAEVVLGNREWIMGCAGAAGPALEGGVARMGMTAGPGAIEKVIIDPETGNVHLKTIGDGPPVGICGSGMIDLVAQLFLAGMIDMRGKFVGEKCRDRIRDLDGIGHYVVVAAQDSATGQDLTLSQPDIDSLIRSKAAMYTILTTITRMVNISFEDIKRFHIAGTFGAYIDPKSAITIGMIPDLPLETYRSLGNTALKGASTALVSWEAREQIESIRDRITYVELNVNQEFMSLFSAAKFIPHTDASLFPSVKEGREKRGI